ncbi:MAG: V-type ATP synthase subunit E family protein [Oscillospiraceae bacterium]
MPYDETDKKLEAFTAAIILEATDDSHNIALELSQRQEQLIAKAETAIAADALRYKNVKIAELRARESRRINTHMTENKRTLLQFREDCATEAFAAVRKKIADFTASDEYLPHLTALLEKAINILGYGFTAEVILRRADMRFADALHASASGVSLAFSEGSFILGGLCVSCASKGLRIDMSFDSALSDMLGHFSELTGLNAAEFDG